MVFTWSDILNGEIASSIRSKLNGLGSKVVTNTTDITNLETTKADLSYTDAQLLLKADLMSPSLTGNPTAPTQALGDNSIKLATTEYVDSKQLDSETIALWEAIIGTGETV